MPTATSKLILASQSPRRRDLLEQAGLTFTVIPSAFDEDAIEPGAPDDFVRTLARSKADDVAQSHAEHWVIGADTIVTIDDRILGKPGDPDEAREMLWQLSGHAHAVYTGYAIVCKAKSVLVCEAIKTDVQFKTLNADEIDRYIRTGEPFDKAGAYAIQGMGTFLVRNINGSYTNVVGLPVCEVVEDLLRLGAVNADRRIPDDLSRTKGSEL
ncbi:MAG: septum formation inhibitor Maf [Proteobacteria bacterium]|nr:MAG: septum formation inhibitor Maf [Pseudomonadota bacterium]PIE66834.1 MAG: septum formation inhibitor Maf [Deltaproteobacteria bacterium]